MGLASYIILEPSVCTALQVPVLMTNFFLHPIILYYWVYLETIPYMVGREQTPLTGDPVMISWLEGKEGISIYSNLILVMMLLMNTIP